MRSSYHIYKVPREHVKGYKIKNTENDKAKDEAMMKNSNSLSSNLIQDKETNTISFKNNFDMPAFLFGA